MCHLCCLPQSPQLSNPTTKKGWPCMLFLKKTLPWVTPNKNIPLHYTSKPTQMILSPPLRVYFPSKKNKSHSTFFLLNCMTSSIQVTKRGEKNMHIEEAHCTKLFYYVYLCKFNVSLFKKVSLAPPLIAPWSMCFNPAVCMKSGGRQGWWIMNGLKQTSTKRKSAEVSLIFNDPPWSLKLSNIKYCRVPSVVVPLLCHR